MTDLSRLPHEVVSRIFRHLDPQELFKKFVVPYAAPNVYSDLALQIIGQVVIIGNALKMKEKGRLKWFYGNEFDESVSFTIDSYEEGYAFIKKLVFISIDNPNKQYLKEIVLIFNVRIEDKLHEMQSQLTAMLKTIELLAFDSYYQNRVLVDLLIAFHTPPPTELEPLLTQLKKRVLALGSKVRKILVQKKYNQDIVPQDKPLFQLNQFSTLEDLRLFNECITDYQLRKLHHLNNSKVLKVLVLNGAYINDFNSIPLPKSLKTLLLIANSIQTIEGVDMSHMTELENLQLVLNEITVMQDVIFPPTLLALKLPYNSTAIADFALPDTLTVLDLSHNRLTTVDFKLPPSIKSVYLNDNNICSFPSDFFAGCTNLEILHLDGNSISDLDELGELPDSLVELILDNNYIDYTVLTNILKPNLSNLSMAGTGLLSLENIEFPSKLVNLNLSNNEIMEVHDVKFGSSNLNVLNLSDNHLESFKCSQNIEISDTVHTIDLTDNKFHDFADIDIPKFCKHVILDCNKLLNVSTDTFTHLPRSLVSLSMNQLLTSSNDVEVDFLQFPNLQYFNFRDSGSLKIVNHGQVRCSVEGSDVILV